MIARLSAQKAYLEHALALIADLPGPILEIGLGKGRTYSHLHMIAPDRTIHAFDDALRAPAGCAPDTAHLALGDFRATLAAARGRIAPAALAHADFGTDDPAADAADARWLAPLIDALMAPGAIVVSDRQLHAPRWSPLPGLPAYAWPYYIAQVGRAP
jgi:hypothetical protein